MVLYKLAGLLYIHNPFTQPDEALAKSIPSWYNLIDQNRFSGETYRVMEEVAQEKNILYIFIRGKKMIRTTVFIIAAVILLPALTFPDTINVPADYLSIQQAIDATVNGDTVLVAPGTYIENIDFIGKAITVKGSQGPQVTFIDGNHRGSVVIFNKGEKSDSVIEGFTIMNGTGTLDINGNNSGGGIYCYASSPTITYNTIKNNSATGGGGGICCYGGHCTPTISNCNILSNKFSHEGGGIYCAQSNALITGCSIMNNISEINGGGIRMEKGGSPIIKGNVIDSNETEFRGGGISSSNGPTPYIENNTITNNMAADGGGIFLYDGHIYNNIIMYNTAKYGSPSTLIGAGGGIIITGYSCPIDNNIIAYNTAMLYGGGIHCTSYNGTISNNIIFNNNAQGGTLPGTKKLGGGICVSLYCSNPLIINCIIFDNYAEDYGGGIYTYDKTTSILNCSLSKNAAQLGSGIYCFKDSYVVVSNTILWDDVGDEIYYESNEPIVTYSDVKGGWAGIGNINADPLFVDIGKDDFHLTFSSPCKDAGDNIGNGLSYDFEGDPRITHGTVDMGADEFYTHLYVTGDKIPGGSIQGKLVGLPGTTPVGLFVGASTLPFPTSTMWGEFWLQAPWFLFGPLGTIPTDGVMVIPTTLPGSLPAPYDVPLQALIGLNFDSLTKLYVLEVR